MFKLGHKYILLNLYSNKEIKTSSFKHLDFQFLWTIRGFSKFRITFLHGNNHIGYITDAPFVSHFFSHWEHSLLLSIVFHLLLTAPKYLDFWDYSDDYRYCKYDFLKLWWWILFIDSLLGSLTGTSHALSYLIQITISLTQKPFIPKHPYIFPFEWHFQCHIT